MRSGVGLEGFGWEMIVRWGNLQDDHDHADVEV